MKRRWLRWLTVLAGLLLVAAAGVYFLLRSQWLREQVRARIVTEVEKATGGKASLGRFDFDPSFLSVTVDDFTLRGTEPASDPPLFHAASVKVGLKVLSFFKPNVDLRSAEIVRPSLRIVTDKDGRTNLPTPPAGRKRESGVVEDVLRLAIDEYLVSNMQFEYDLQKANFSVSGKDLNARFTYSSDGPKYDGHVGVKQMLLRGFGLPRLPWDFDTTLTLTKDAVAFPAANIASGPTRIAAAGRIDGFTNPTARFDVKVQTNATEAARLFDAEIGNGPVRSAGKFVWTGGENWSYKGSLDARPLDITVAGLRVNPANVTGSVTATADGLDVDGVVLETTEGRFTGRASLPDYKAYHVEGDIEELALQTIGRRSGREAIPYSGLLSGPVRLAGEFKGSFQADADLYLAPTAVGIPVEGQLKAVYRHALRTTVIEPSYITFPGSRLDVSGTLGQTLRVKLATSRVEDLYPAFTLFGNGPPPKIPVTIEKGSALFEGTVSGELIAPLIAGQLRGVNVKYENTLLDAASTTVLLAEDRLTLTRFSFTQNGARVTGNGTLALNDWKADEQSAVDADFEVRSLDLGRLRREFRLEPRISGLVNATGEVKGTLGEPEGFLTLDAFRPGYGEERADRLRASLRHAGNRLLIDSFELTRGTARATATGEFRHQPADLQNGRLALNFQLAAIDLAAIEAVKQIRADLGGTLQGKGAVKLILIDGAPEIEGLDGELSLKPLLLGARPYLEATLTAATANGAVSAKLAGALRGSQFQGTSQWRLAKGYPGSGKLEFASVPFRILEEMRPQRVEAESWPFTGSFRGAVEFNGPLVDIEQWRTRVAIDALEARLARDAQLPNGRQPDNFVLRNDGPVVFTSQGRAVNVESARFLAPDTRLSVAGTFSLAQQRPWDLRVNGNVNLAGLRAFSPDILASGVATLQATVRGELADPQVLGSMELRNASLNVEGIPNGLDKVNGRVLLDRRRATIEDRLTAESGGGGLSLSGFVEYSGEETFYRLTAQANRVRIRYPEGVSTVADANLNLTGSSERSLLSGSVTVLRSGFTPRTDLGSLLAESSRAQPAPTEPNRFLTNMQLDVKVRTSSDTQFTTSVTSDLQADANLNLRGTGASPAVMGRISVSQGDINFFGNKYTIRRGEINFYNPTRIEPTLDMDLETRVRGIAVIVNFSGPVDRLNVSYRSDPPMQSSEIIALLTVGRSPTTSTVGTSQSYASGSFLESGANSLLGSAISAPISSQLQRFFGVSRVKIDPLITGLEGTPQARLTIEQQVSRDVTLTYVTNLNRSQQQVVRLEWNLSREWSLIALRDENGSFGVDFQFRKQVK
jgi:translocation and assembly module TamB